MYLLSNKNEPSLNLTIINEKNLPYIKNMQRLKNQCHHINKIVSKENTPLLFFIDFGSFFSLAIPTTSKQRSFIDVAT